MPCQDYDTRWSNDWDRRAREEVKEEMKQHADMLARIACKALTELEDNGIAEVLLLKDDEVREWWAKHKEADAKAKAARAEKARKARIKKEALAKLSDEERKILGVK